MKILWNQGEFGVIRGVLGGFWLELGETAVFSPISFLYGFFTWGHGRSYLSLTLWELKLKLEG